MSQKKHGLNSTIKSRYAEASLRKSSTHKRISELTLSIMSNLKSPYGENSARDTVTSNETKASKTQRSGKTSTRRASLN